MIDFQEDIPEGELTTLLDEIFDRMRKLLAANTLHRELIQKFAFRLQAYIDGDKRIINGDSTAKVSKQSTDQSLDTVAAAGRVSPPPESAESLIEQHNGNKKAGSWENASGDSIAVQGNSQQRATVGNRDSKVQDSLGKGETGSVKSTLAAQVNPLVSKIHRGVTGAISKENIAPVSIIEPRPRRVTASTAAKTQPQPVASVSARKTRPRHTGNNAAPNVTERLPVAMVPPVEPQAEKTLKKSIRTLKPTSEEWQDFKNFYELAQSTDNENLGVVLVDLPPPLRDAIMPPSTKHLSMYGMRSELKRSAKGFIQANNMREESTGSSTKFRLNSSIDISEPVICQSVKEVIDRFENSKENVFCGPIYAVGKDVNSAEHRRFYGLPPVSAIFPLRGNGLDNTRVALAGIHTPWMCVSEGFGTCFTLHTEDFGLSSLNVVVAGASKIWTVISPLDSRKLETSLLNEFRSRESCGQFVRHMSTYVTRSRLEDLGIRYTEFEQQRGQVVITFPNAYHQGFNTGLNMAEAVNFATQEKLETLSGYLPCTRKSCGNSSPSLDNLAPLLDGETQKLIGISTPWEIEKLQLKRGQKRKRGAAVHGEGASTLLYQHLEITDKIKEHQEQTPNTNCDGLPIIDIRRVYSYLLEKKVKVEKNSQTLSHHYAAALALMVMEWGGPKTMQQLCTAIRAVKNRPLSQVDCERTNDLSKDKQVQRLVDRVRTLEYLEEGHLIGAIATRYHLANLAKEFEAISGTSQSELSSAYQDIISKLNPSMNSTSDIFKKQRDKFRTKVAYGRKWQKMVSKFGLSVIALLPYEVSRGTCNSLIHAMPLAILDIWIETMKSEQEKWTLQFSDDFGKWVIDRLNCIENEAVYGLEVADPLVLGKKRYLEVDLLNCCIRHHTGLSEVDYLS